MGKRVEIFSRLQLAQMLARIECQCAELSLVSTGDVYALIALQKPHVKTEPFASYFGDVRRKAAERGISADSLSSVNLLIGRIEQRLGMPLSPDSAASSKS